MHNKASSSKLDEDNQKSLQREIRNMILTLTNRLTQLHPMTKHGLSHRLGDDKEDEHGLSAIHLAGNNTGATMHGVGDMKDKLDGRGALPDDQEEQETLEVTYANSNYQAINNSIMMGGDYKAKDPGIHIDVFDHGEEDGQGKHKKKKKKKKKKMKKYSSDSSEEDSHSMEGHGKHKGKESKKVQPFGVASEKTSDGE